MRQRTEQAQAEEIAKGHVIAGLVDHLAVREIVVALQEFQLQQQDRLDRWPAMVGTVKRRHFLPKALEVDHRQHAAQIMIGSNGGLENEVIQCVGYKVWAGCWQHGSSTVGPKGYPRWL